MVSYGRAITATYVHEEILDGERRLGRHLDLDAVFVLEAVEDLWDVLAVARLADAHSARVNGRFDRVRLHHGLAVLARLPRDDVNVSVLGAGQAARDEAARELPRRRRARCQRVKHLIARAREHLERARREALRVSLVQRLGDVIGVRRQVRVDHADDAEPVLTPLRDLRDLRLVCPRHLDREPVHLALLPRLPHCLHHRLDAHRHLVVAVVVPDEEREALVPRLAPGRQDAVDQTRGRKLDVVHHAERLRLQGQRRRLTLRADALGKRRVRATRARRRYAQRERVKRGHVHGRTRCS